MSTYVPDELYKYAIQPLLTSINLACPTGIEQRAFVTFLHAMQKDGLSYREQYSALVGALFDGIKFGNWPK